MLDLAPVDKVEVQILVDDVNDPLSSVPDYAESDLGYLMRIGKMPIMAAKNLCCAVHGFSCLVTTHRGSQKHTIIFDTGPEAYAFARNCQRLDVDVGAVEGIVLSHGHLDHGGGLLAALDAIREHNGNCAVPLYMHPDVFRSRGLMMPNGNVIPFEDIPAIEALTSHGASISKSSTKQVILDGAFFISGEVPRVTPFERGLPGHCRRSGDGKNWEPDPLIMDERFLAVSVAGKGLVLFSGCSHAGIINVLQCARSEMPHTPVYGLFGGLHLVGVNEPLIQETVEAMRPFQLHVMAVGHCTGWRAVHALTAAFGDQIVAPCAVGKRYIF